MKVCLKIKMSWGYSSMVKYIYLGIETKHTHLYVNNVTKWGRDSRQRVEQYPETEKTAWHSNTHLLSQHSGREAGGSARVQRQLVFYTVNSRRRATDTETLFSQLTSTQVQGQTLRNSTTKEKQGLKAIPRLQRV